MSFQLPVGGGKEEEANKKCTYVRSVHFNIRSDIRT